MGYSCRDEEAGVLVSISKLRFPRQRGNCQKLQPSTELLPDGGKGIFTVTPNESRLLRESAAISSPAVCSVHAGTLAKGTTKKIRPQFRTEISAHARRKRLP